MNSSCHLICCLVLYWSYNTITVAPSALQANSRKRKPRGKKNKAVKPKMDDVTNSLSSAPPSDKSSEEEDEKEEEEKVCVAVIVLCIMWKLRPLRLCLS